MRRRYDTYIQFVHIYLWGLSYFQFDFFLQRGFLHQFGTEFMICNDGFLMTDYY